MPTKTEEKRKGRPPSHIVRRVALTIKATEEWKDWLNEFSEFMRAPASSIADNALARYAKFVGFEREVPKR